MFQILEITGIKEVEKKRNNCPNFGLVIPMINLKNIGRKQKVGFAQKCAIWMGILTLGPVFYLT